MADRAGLLAVARQPRGGQRVERHALGAAGEERLADAGPPVDPLQRPDVEVLAGVRARQDRDLRRLEVERLDRRPPRSARAAPNGLTVERSVTTRSGSPSWRISRPAASTSTMSPRWTLSSIPLRIWRTRIGGTARPRRRRGRPRRHGLRRGAAGRAGRDGHGRWVSDTGGLDDGPATASRDGDSARGPRLVTARIAPRLVRWAAPEVHSPSSTGGHPCPPRPSMSRSIRLSCTSSRSCATNGPSRRSSASSSASCRGCSATRRWPTSGSGRSRSGRRWSR